MDRDKDGYRTYRLKVLVRSDSSLDGPSLALQTDGLPIPGDVWSFDNDLDPWCYCQLPVSVTPVDENGPNHEFELEFTFSNRPDEKRCKQNQIDDPLLMPPEISGGFIRFQEEAQLDRYGKPILTSSHELIRGPHNEWDRNRPKISITQHVATLNLVLLAQMVDTVNAFPLWGLPTRTIKLSHVSWQRKFYGQCYVYYTRTLEFEIAHRKIDSVLVRDSGCTGTAPNAPPLVESRYENWDRQLLDEGTKALNGGWDASGNWKLKKIAGIDPDPSNPAHFCAFRGRDGNLMKCILNGRGLPFQPGDNSVVAACGEATTPSPKVWRMYIEDYQTEGVGPVELTHAGGCTWTGTSGDLSYTLTYVPSLLDNQSTWQLTESPSGYKWLQDEMNWSPLGPNTMSPWVEGMPPSHVELVYGAEPGMISVSVYGESDFLLLGIPISF